MKKGFRTIAIGFIMFSGTPGICVISVKAQPSYENYSLVWSDEFDGNGLVDSKNWGYEEGYVRNDELQYYTRQRLENASMEDGNLIIEARRDNWNGNEYTSASLHSRGKKEFQYGIFEIKAKIDVRQGSWPAFWTLGVSEEWPSNGEIDIMEYYAGNLHANVAWGTDTRWSAKWDSQTKAVGSDFSNDFHIWRMHWTEDKVELYVDDFLQNTTDLSTTINGSLATLRNPFHQKAYIMINQAIGSNGGNPSGTTFPIQYIIDYVRVYQEAPDSIAPAIVDAIASVNGTISILFSEGLNKQSTEIISNYSISNSGVTLISAELQNDGKTVVLTFSDLNNNKELNLTVNGIKDDADPVNVIFQSVRTVVVGPESNKLTGKLIGDGEPYNNNSSVEYKTAVDGNTSTYADCEGSVVWVGYDFGTGNEMVITGIRYYPRSGYADRMNGRSIEVSSDCITWEKLLTISQTPPEESYSKLPVVHSKPVRFVRYNGTGGYLNVSEIEFLGYPGQSTSISYGKSSSSGSFQKLLPEGPFRYSCYTLDGRVFESRIINNRENMVKLFFSFKNGKQLMNNSNGLYFVKIESNRNQKLLYQGLVNRNH